eukprot:4457099-Amphidinium_carterae.1
MALQKASQLVTPVNSCCRARDTAWHQYTNARGVALGRGQHAQHDDTFDSSFCIPFLALARGALTMTCCSVMKRTSAASSTDPSPLLAEGWWTARHPPTPQRSQGSETQRSCSKFSALAKEGAWCKQQN